MKSLEEGQRRLEGGSRSKGPRGTNVLGFEGEGNRHYLTGLKVRGERILFLVDTSARVILLPFEGDPQAASAFWVASRHSGGEFIEPARDWP